MIRSLSLAILLSAAGFCAAHDATDPTIWQLSAEAGLGPSVRRGYVPITSPLGDIDRQKLNAGWAPSPGLGAAVTRVSIDPNGFGWHAGLGLSVNHWQGRLNHVSLGDVSITSGKSLRLDGGLATFAIGPTWRWDGRIMHAQPTTWEYDCSLLLGGGLMQARISGQEPSGWGLTWLGGLRNRISLDIGDGWRIAGDLGGAYSETKVTWSNTRLSTITSWGPIAGIALIREF